MKGFKNKEFDSPEVPSKFESFGFKKFHAFSEGFTAFSSAKRGCLEVPLVCVLSKHVAATAEMLDHASGTNAGNWSSTDERLINVVQLAGADFGTDNRRVWKLMVPYIQNTSAWPYVKRFATTMNGHAAFLVLNRR